MSVQQRNTTTFTVFEGFSAAPEFAAAKRGLDLLFVLAALLLIAPLLAVLASAIKLDTKGPLLFRQRRIGKGGQIFSIYKFRSMRVLEDGDVVTQAVKDDTRVTRVGRFLRAFSLDELPQLFNVLKGDMSLVGPRPHAVAHDDYYSARLPDYVLRHQVKPGITGWAQIHGHRGPTPTLDLMQRRIEHDVWYVRNASLRLDIEIILRTPLEVISRRNAH